MGLDMYLKATLTVSQYGDKEEQARYNSVKACFPFHDKQGCASITATIKYWRKANAIHAWFVKEVGKNIDECQTMPVSRADITKLITAITTTLSHKDKITTENISEFSDLTPQEGFFFGSTEADEWYWSDLESTLPVLQQLLEPEWKDYDFSYRASW